MTEASVMNRAEAFLVERNIDFVRQGRFGDKSGQKVEVIFPVAETLNPNVAVIDPPDVRVWVDQLSGEVELAYQM